jgi:cysteine desulfurase
VQQGRNPESIHIAISSIEHPCVKACAERLKQRGAHVVSVPVRNEGTVNPAFFDDGVDWDIVSIMAVNHETGAIQPLNEIARRLDSDYTFFHTDAAQWAGRSHGNLQEWGVSALSLSAHKLYGPKGIGVLILQRKHSVTPLFPGAQEAGLRAGTVNVPAAVGFGIAAQLIRQEQVQEYHRLFELREYFWNQMNANDLHPQRTIVPELSMVNTLHVRFEGFRAERIVDSLDQKGICCSAGPACSSGASDPSPVLLAMGCQESHAWEGIRFSLGKFTTRYDIDQTVQALTEIISPQSQHVA